MNIRQDPFERTPSIDGESLNDLGGRLHERFLCPGVLAVRSRPAEGGGAGQDGHRLPADAGPGLFNLDAVKKKIDEAIKNKPGQ